MFTALAPDMSAGQGAPPPWAPAALRSGCPRERTEGLSMTDRKQEKQDEKSRPFVFRIATEEADKLVAIAVAKGMTPGQLARGIIEREIGLIARTATVRRRVANADLLRQGLGQLGSVGNNINQVAAHLNGGRPLPWGQDELERMRLGLDTTLAAIMAALGRGRP